MFKNLTTLGKYRELIYQLTMREIKSRYKQSFLGYAWVILNPFFQILVMTMVFSTIMRIPSLGMPYPIFLYVALLPWTLFAQSLASSTGALVGNASLLKKIYFPREIFVISTIIAKVVDFLLASLVFILFMLYFHIKVDWHLLWILPIFTIQMLFTYGISLVMAAINLFYRDIQYLLNLILMLWMYLTPIIYPVEMVPDRLRFVFSLNPMAVLINAYRQVILGMANPKLSSLSIALVISLLFCLIGNYIFKRLEGSFADVV